MPGGAWQQNPPKPKTRLARKGKIKKMFANKYKVAGVNLSNLKTIWGDGVQTEPGTPEHQERMARRVGPDIVPMVAPENDVTDGTR